MEQNSPSATRSMLRYPVLDGWRGISILCVLAAHMLPLGPKSWQGNSMAAVLGMSLFFTLSGFLITSTLIYRANVYHFLIRRFCRILPLAWLFIIVALLMTGATPNVWAAHFLFYGNLPPFWLTNVTAHFWSLCVEMQFYVGIAVLVLLLRQRGLLLLPGLCLAFTGARILNSMPVSIVTYYRVDEILVGACLALVYERRLGAWMPKFLGWVSPIALLGLLLVCCHPQTGAANYLRPYVAALLVGSTIYQGKNWLTQGLIHPILTYLAAISYALYVIHPLSYYGWLGSDEPVSRYFKRPISFVLTFGLAHLSTFYYEKSWIEWGKRWTQSHTPNRLATLTTASGAQKAAIVKRRPRN